jgi:hypothetical protein
MGLDDPQETAPTRLRERSDARILRDYTPGIQVIGGCTSMNLSSDWVVGFVDGEGCFFVGIQRNPKVSVGFQVIPEFRVVQHQRDLDVLHALKRFFGFGRVCRNHGERWEYRVRRLEHLKIIAAFFERNHLRTKKRIDHRKFSTILRMMENGTHLEINGVKKIARIAASMNTGNRPRLSAILDEDRVHSDAKAPDEK